MLFVVIGSSNGKTRDEVMAVYPRHAEFLAPFFERGEIVGIGPFVDPDGGNMAIFRSRSAAMDFAQGDPFFREGLVKEYLIKEWADKMLT
jgi:uncharacterized protein YciI